MKEKIIDWIQKWFKSNGGQTAIIGISGGKDSAICAALCVEALGVENVIGILMPNGYQKDIEDSIKVCEFLKIKNYVVNISQVYDSLLYAMVLDKRIDFGKDLSKVPDGIKTNLPARLRMATLYNFAVLYPNARVCNTCNYSEDYIGYFTKFGDGAGDFSPLADLTVREILALGDELGLPYELVHKAPSDGMCGKSDEENISATYGIDFTYEKLDRSLLFDYDAKELAENKEMIEKFREIHKQNLHKIQTTPYFNKYQAEHDLPYNFEEEEE